jgi:hypothetical protein
MRACIAAIALALLGGCATSTGTGVVGINRTQLFMVPAAQVNDLAAGSVAASGASQAWEEIGSFEGATVTVQSEVITGVMRKAWVKQSYPQPGYSKSQTGSAQWTTTSMFVVNCEEKRSLMQSVATDSMYGSRVFVAIGDPLLHVDQSQMTVPASGTAAAAVLQLICSRGGVKSPVSSSEPLRG